MRILVLTSLEPRHLYLVKTLLDHGHDVLAWAEEKGNSLNRNAFTGGQESLFELHALSLRQAMETRFPTPKTNEVSLEVFDRGMFGDSSLADRARDFSADCVASYGCGMIGEPLLSVAGDCMLGSHQGLPQYFRGGGSNFFAFTSEQSTRMGVSLHFLDQGIDTGPVISQYASPPNADDTYYSYSSRLVNETIQLYVEAISRMENSSPSDLKSTSTPLPYKGSLSQRKDFTPETLETMLMMQLRKSMSAWYSDSMDRVGPAVLVHTQA